MAQAEPKISVLCIEDSESDRRLIQEFMDCRTFRCSAEFANDGAEALDHLFQRNGFQAAAPPDLILLDLNLPKIDGREVLRIVKTTENLKHIPVIIFTTSDSDTDVSDCFKAHANCYLVKPVDVDQFEKTMETIESFWMSATKLCRGRKCA